MLLCMTVVLNGCGISKVKPGRVRFNIIEEKESRVVLKTLPVSICQSIKLTEDACPLHSRASFLKDGMII